MNMYKHLKVFLFSWAVLSIALVFFPGFELRGLAVGMIIGCWPAILSQQICDSQYQHPAIILGMMIVLSGITVALLAWLLDKAQMPKTIWIALATAMIIGIFSFNVGALTYEQWERSSIVVQAMESANHQPTRWDYYKQIAIPRSLAGGLWGLYGILGVCALWSVAVLLKRKAMTSRLGDAKGS
jgi:hypothetical protein